MSHETFETTVRTDGLSLPATLTLPADIGRGGLVPLHGAGFPSRDFFIYQHLADVLSDAGWATLRYDRRPSDRMVPLRHQVSDALEALNLLRSRPELEGAPVGFWGLSQGAWTAVLAAAGSNMVDLLVLVGFSGVSPGRQMRYATANFLRQEGYDSDRDLQELAELRTTYERYLRGDQDRASAQRQVDELRNRPWFNLAYVDATLPDRSVIDDPLFFDFEPEDHVTEVKCPVLAFYGDQDDTVPVADSVALLQRAARNAGNEVSVQVLEGVGHALTVDDRDETDALHPDYQPQLVRWLNQQANIKR
jgi:pimeloyl-ACP methyl ester carboxylesterase